MGGLLHRAQSYLTDKDYDRGEQDLERAIKIDRTQPAAVVALTSHFTSQGMTARASKVIQEAMPYLKDDLNVQALAKKLNVSASKDAHLAAQGMQAKQQVQKSQEVPCPSCKRPVMEWAAICPHCGIQIKAIPSLFATRQAETKLYHWQDYMYYIVSVLWTLLGAAPLILIGILFGLSKAFSGLAAVPTTVGLAKIGLGIGLLFQSDFAMTFARWLAIIGLLWDTLSIMIDFYSRQPIRVALDIVGIGLSGFLIYLINYLGID